MAKMINYINGETKFVSDKKLHGLMVKFKFPEENSSEDELSNYIESKVEELVGLGYSAVEIRDEAVIIADELQQKYIAKNMKDLLSGKYRSIDEAREKMPLFNDVHPDGSSDCYNVPQDCMNWFGTIGWINSYKIGL